MLLDIDANHPVFCDFKGCAVRSPSTLIYPSGASGNFLAGLMQGQWWFNDPLTNDWGAPTNYLQLDDNSINLQNGSMDLGKLYSRAASFVADHHVWDQQRMWTGHEPPYLTSHVVDFYTDELITVTLTMDDAWIPELLRHRKNKFTTDFTRKPWSVIEIMNKNRYQGKIDYLEYLDSMAKLRGRVNDFNILGTQFSILYFCDCKVDGKDPADQRNFDDYVRSNMGYCSAFQRFECDYYHKTREWCAQRAGIYTPIDYCDFFFRLQLPTRGALSALDRSTIADYSTKNLDLLDQFMQIIPQDDRYRMQQLLSKLRYELSQSRP